VVSDHCNRAGSVCKWRKTFYCVPPHALAVAYEYTLHILPHNVTFRPRQHYAGEVRKRRFHSENASNVFCPHDAGEIVKRSCNRRQKCLNEPLKVRVNHMIILTSSLFDKLYFQNVFRPHYAREIRQKQLFFLRLGLPSTLTRRNCQPKTELFENALQAEEI